MFPEGVLPTPPPCTRVSRWCPCVSSLTGAVVLTPWLIDIDMMLLDIGAQQTTLRFVFYYRTFREDVCVLRVPYFI